jgi:hypothetical protein
MKVTGGAQPPKRGFFFPPYGANLGEPSLPDDSIFVTDAASLPPITLEGLWRTARGGCPLLEKFC